MEFRKGGTQENYTNYVSSMIHQVHTLTSDIALTQLSLERYGKENLFTYLYTDFYQDINEQFDISSGVDLKTFEMPHRHNYFEILLVLDGALDIIVDGNIVHYSKGDLCLLNRNTKHHEEFRGNFKINYFCLSPNYMESFPVSSGNSTHSFLNILRFFRQNLDDDSRRNKDYIDFFLLNKQCDSLGAELIWNHIRQEMQEKQAGYELFIKGWLNRLFALLGDGEQYCFEHKNLGLLSEKNITDEVIHYINTKNAKVTREEIASALSYNGDYINRVFKKQTGKSILDYCHTVCMEEAARLLSTTDLDIQHIVKQLGYENRTHFNRMFKDYFQMTPGEYRMRHLTR